MISCIHLSYKSKMTATLDGNTFVEEVVRIVNKSSAITGLLAFPFCAKQKFNFPHEV